MTELYPNISDETRRLTSAAFDLALAQKNAVRGTKVLENYLQTLKSEEEKEFANFYFNLKMEQLVNESNNDKR